MTENPEDVAKFFVDAWNNNNADGIAELFAEDAEFVNVTGLWWHTRDRIRSAHKYGFERIFSGARAVIKRVKVKRLTKDVAVVHAKMELTGQTGTLDVKHPQERQNIFSFVMQRNEQGWICVSAQNTDIVPGMETMIRDEKGFLKGVNYRGDQRV